MIRKIKKLFRDPKGFFLDSRVLRAILKSKNEKIAIFIGFSTWKTFIRKYFKSKKIIFLDKNISSIDLNKTLRKHGKDEVEVFIWGYKATKENLRLLQKKKVIVNFVEDGFIRSVDLGASKSPPLSLCIDKKGAYFDATKETSLENALNSYDIKNDHAVIDIANKAIATIIEDGISKYNISPHRKISEIYGIKNSKRILVIGQVEDDASIKYGYNGNITNNDLVRLAVAENPTAQIIYKPHPDVLQGYRDKRSDPKEVEDICMILTEDVSLSSSLDTIDHVYTITSLSGFEALLRGIKVTTLGDPFYSNWGLTDDRQINIRKKRKLTTEELFAIAYIIYPKYFDPQSGNEIDIITAIKKIQTSKKQIYNNNKVSIQKKSIALSYLEEVKNLIQKGSWERAEVLCKQQWHNSPWDLELTLLLARVYRQNFKYDSAIFICEALSARVKNFRVLIELFNCLQSRGDKSDRLKHILIEAINISPNGNNQARIELVKYLWGTIGVGPELLEQSNYLSRSDNLAPLNNMLLAAIFCEAGRYLLAERQFLLAKDKDSNILIKVQYFHLLEYLCLKGHLDDNLSRLVTLISQKIKDGQQYFIDTIKNNKNQFSLVGNAPTEIGKKSGSDIDSSNIVIRFNAYSIDFPQHEDYGSKTDVWVKTGSYLDVPRRNLNEFKVVVISGYNPANRNAMGLDLFIDFIECNAHVCCIPNRIYEELFLKLGAPPSAGLAISYWIYKILGPLDKERVFGFSYGNQSKHISEHYFSNNHCVNYSSHLWKSEGKLLESFIV